MKQINYIQQEYSHEYYVKLLAFISQGKMMLEQTDQEFLNHYVSYFKLISESTGELLGGILSINKEILYKSVFSERIGVSYNELVAHLHKPEVAALQDKAMHNKKTIKYLLMDTAKNGQSLFLVITYAPIINPKTGNIVALYSSSKLVDTLNIWFMLSKHYSKSAALIDKFDYPIKLTNREKQVVFLFLLNLESNTIAEIISKIEGKKISKNAIDQVFKSQLIPKFSVFGRKALYEKLIDLGYYRFIPNNILRDGFCIEITDYTVLDHPSK